MRKALASMLVAFVALGAAPLSVPQGPGIIEGPARPSVAANVPPSIASPADQQAIRRGLAAMEQPAAPALPARVAPRPARPVDVQSARVIILSGGRNTNRVSAPARPSLVRQPAATTLRPMTVATGSTPAPTGINHWWEYQQDRIPGVGTYMANVGTGNLMIQSDDMNVAHKGIALAFRRVYNSMSRHTYTGADGAQVSNYGDGWTNNFDAHIAANTGASCSGVATAGLTVFDIDGTQYDYMPDCHGGYIAPAGVYDTLALDSAQTGFQWTRKNGTVYDFYTPYQAASTAGIAGRLRTIFGRNSANTLTFNYLWDNGDASTAAHLQKIQVIPEYLSGQTSGFPVLTFADFYLTSCQPLKGCSHTFVHRLLSTLAWPDGTLVAYNYTLNSSANYAALTWVSKPGNSTSTGSCAANQPSCLISQYGVTSTGKVASAISPRAFGTTTNGGNLVFNYNPDNSVASIAYYGAMNFTPSDGTSAQLQPGYSTSSALYRTVTFSRAAPTLTWSDSYGHKIVYTYDTLGRITQRIQTVSASQTLTTASTWCATAVAPCAANALASVISPGGFAPGAIRSNYETDYQYDNNGNTAAIIEPPVSANSVTVRPTRKYIFDGHFNVIVYCDPVYNAAHATCAAGPGAQSYNWSPAPNESFGCLTDIYSAGTQTASGQVRYHTALSYGGGCGSFGLPSDVVGDAFTVAAPTAGNPNATATIQPQQHITYNPSGTTATYFDGQGTHSFGYDALNRVTSMTDPDANTHNMGAMVSYKRYYPDGSLQCTDTPQQYALDGAACGAHADQYGYDADGNEISETKHFGQTPTNAPAAGVTQKWYDGADRLVEVMIPSDVYTDNGVAERTRYIYDLSQGGTVQIDATNQSPSFRAFGNMYKTQKFFIAGGNGSWSVASSPSDISGDAYDGLDRSIAHYAYSPGNGLQTWTKTYDAGTYAGMLTSKKDPTGATSTYTYDALDRVLSESFSDGTPNRTYTYDADGHKINASSSVFSSPDVYAYDADGNVTTYTEATGATTTANATLRYAYYPNGWRNTLSIQSSALTQSDEFTYGYRNDGKRADLLVAGHGDFHWSYTNAGRELSQTDPLTGQTATPPGYASNGPPGAFTQHTMLARTQTFNAYGELASLQLPNHGTYSITQNDAEGNITRYNATADDIVPGSGSLITGMQLDYDVRGEAATIETTAPGSGPYATGTFLYGHNCSGVVYGGANTNMPGSGGDCSGVSYNTGQYIEPFAYNSVDPYTGATLTGSAQTAMNCPGSGIQYIGSVLKYDTAGREQSDTINAGTCWNTTTLDTRSYDADNHLIYYNCDAGSGFPACTWSDGVSYLPNYEFIYGPNNKMRVDTSPSYPNTAATLHWDGDNLLFITNSAGQLIETEVEMLGAVQVSGASYMKQPATGMVVNDHDFAGMTVGMHYAGHDDFWSYGTPYTHITQTGFLNSGACVCNDYAAAWAPIYEINGQRSDGYMIQGLIVQGPRVYDQLVSQWSQPDAYRGVVDDPMSQRSYMWNNNNPVAYSDPSGYCAQPQGNVAAFCMDAYISQPAALGYKGDDRGPSANCPSCTYRMEITIDFTHKTYTITAGESHYQNGWVAGQGSKEDSSVTWTDDGAIIHLRGQVGGAASAWGHSPTWLTPDIEGDFYVSKDGSLIVGSHTQFPSFEAYFYKGGRAYTMFTYSEDPRTPLGPFSLKAGEDRVQVNDVLFKF